MEYFIEGFLTKSLKGYSVKEAYRLGRVRRTNNPIRGAFDSVEYYRGDTDWCEDKAQASWFWDKEACMQLAKAYIEHNNARRVWNSNGTGNV